MLDTDMKFVLNENIVLRGIRGKFWALDVTSGSQYKLNESAYFLLKRFEQPESVESVLDYLMKEYAVDYEQLKNDCEAVIDFAVSKNILRKVES